MTLLLLAVLAGASLATVVAVVGLTIEERTR